MTTFRKFLLLVAWLASPTLVEAEVIEVTIYADADYPSYSYQESGKARGIYAEILQRAFSKMDRYHVSIVPVPYKRGLAYLESGKGFALYPPYYRPIERPYINPYSVPILEESVVVFCSQQVLEKPRTRWPEDYFGLVFGNNGGFKLGGEKFKAAVISGDIRLDEVGGNRQNILKLMSGRIDCYVNDRGAVLWEYAALRKSGQPLGRAGLKEGAFISSEYGFLGFTDRDKGAFYYKDRFVSEFNEAINIMKTSGEIAEIVDLFMKN